jgi:hypothetical protein
MRLKLHLFALATALVLFVPVVSAQSNDQNESEQKVEAPKKKTRFEFGGFQVGLGYSNYSRHYPVYGHFPYYFSPFYGYGPAYYHPVFLHGSRPGTGRVKLINISEEAAVFINGGFAGIGKDLGSFRLEPGVYELSIRREGYQQIERKLYVLTDKSIEIVLKWKKGEMP